MYKNCFKRLFDFVIALCAIIVLSPFLMAITIWLHFANHGAGAFFFQERPGLHGSIFKVVKYKTMTDERGADGKLLPDEQRLTTIGQFVRSTSIDEIPQLFNVLKGDMALIGPRPLLPRYLPWYTEEEMHRHDVRPGISGYAQCHGRNDVTWDEKLAMDVWYTNHVSLKTDLDIIFKTIKAVFKRESVEVAGVEALDTYRKRNNHQNDNSI
jgi:undecaprenyl phosphate N,N'-diacetylbacillosamine 1-phosphate transferase